MNRKVIFAKSLLVCLTLFLSLLISGNKSFAGDIIQNIVVKNNERVEASTVESYLNISKGSSYSEEKINQSLKSLFETGLFSDVKISKENNSLIVTVTENPVVNKIDFEGNKRINNDTLSAELSLKARAVYSKAKLQNDVDRIQSIYKKNGRFSATVEPKIIKLDHNRVNIVYEIKEGAKTTVQSIHFIGNSFFTSKALRAIVSTKEGRWYRFFSSSDNYDQDRVSYDKELLRKEYLASGFADFKVTSSLAQLSEDKKHFIITFMLEEGNRYKFGNIDIKNKLPNVKVEKLTSLIQTKKNDIFNANQINETVEKITNQLNNMGYAFVAVNPEYSRNEVEKTVALTYSINEGPRVYIEQINILGNVRTLDKVIRRELRFAEGDPFNSDKIKRSKERVQNLDFFDKVDINNEQGSSPDKTNIVIAIKERSTGELNFGAGFSTTDGPLGNVSLRERNLLGTGQDVRLSYQQSAISSQTNLGYTQPYFMDKDFSAGFDVFKLTQDQSSQSSFSSTTDGVTLRGSYSLSEYLRHNVYYSLQDANVGDIQPNASSFVTQQQGNNVASMVGHSLTYDKRNSSVDPTNGYLLQISQEIAGFGGDSKYYKHEAKAGYYYPLYKNDVVLNLRGKAGDIEGYGGTEPRINEKFFIGSGTIRGFDYAGIGPRDKTTNDALGGKDYYFGSTEIFFPLGLPKELDFKGSVFLDAASLFNSGDPGVNDTHSLRASVGVGISWSSPLGPISLDIANPFMKESFDKTQNIQFNFGTKF